ncbi:MAG TPA: exonuclease domain-containing protein [Acidimicrobiales bacterium]|nr:exonuclease domain-containing protein [Acidimicrobiales bacterium]
MTLSYDEPTTPLHQVTFCVVDLETTGASSATCAITEVGAAKFRGGECLGTFQTLVDAGVPVSPVAARITGITDEMIAGAPPLPGVLAALGEFVGGAVLVGHNLRFDVSFLDAALAAGGRDGVRLRLVDTVALARRLVGDDVPDCRLATLAGFLGLPHRPSHRALDDVLATADLLHALLEQAAGAGVVTLDDLLAFPRLAGHPQAAKLPLTNGLPRGRGVYLFRDGQGRALYAGAASDVRRRVRGFFARRVGGGDGRTVRQLLRTVQRIDHVATRSALESVVATVRIVQSLAPRHNRTTGRWRQYRYVRLPGRDGSGRATVVPSVRGGAVHVGPFPTPAAARAVASAIGSETRESGDAVVAELAREVALGGPSTLAWSDRVTLAGGLTWLRRIESQRRPDRLVLRLPGGPDVELRRGRLALDPSGPADDDADDLWVRISQPPVAPPADDELPGRREAEELDVVAAWLDRRASRVRLVHVDGELSCTWPALRAPPTCADRPRSPPTRPAATHDPPILAGGTAAASYFALKT